MVEQKRIFLPESSLQEEFPCICSATAIPRRCIKKVSLGVSDECMVKNMDETHFVLKQDDNHALGFMKQRDVHYAKVVFCGDDSGVAHFWWTRVKTPSPFLFFNNWDRKYPIFCVTHTVLSISYRTGSRAWMDNKMFNRCLNELRAIDKDPMGRKRVAFLGQPLDLLLFTKSRNIETRYGSCGRNIQSCELIGRSVPKYATRGNHFREIGGQMCGSRKHID